MRDQTIRRPGRFGKGPRSRAGSNGRGQNGSEYGRGRGRSEGSRRNVNGNRLTKNNGNRGETALCIKCGHPAPDGKLCAFHRILLNTSRKEVPEQDPRRLRF
jgi:hypothetical protein